MPLLDVVEGHAIPSAEVRIAKLQKLLERFVGDLPVSYAFPPPGTGPGHDMHIVLTGSTGSLGSHMLHHLIAVPGVTKIYCLNRAVDGQEKQKQSNAERGLTDIWSPDQVKFIHTDMSKSKFGLDDQTYKLLSDDATHILHIQWPVDFVSPVEQFEDHIRGVRNIIDFSVASPKRPSIVFASSVAVAPYWAKRHPGEMVPEAPIHDLAVAELGYGESKIVAELLLEQAGRTCGTHSTVLRIGHISGPVEKDGFWNKGEWVPSTIFTCRSLGMIPHTLDYINNVDWIPVDVLSDAIIELMHSETGRSHRAELEQGSCLVYNCVNPHETTWTSLVPTINQHLHGGQLREAPFAEWIEALQEAGDRGGSVEEYPASKLLDFYNLCAKAAAPGHEMPRYATAKAVASSKTMASLQPIGQENMSRWMEQWNF